MGSCRSVGQSVPTTLSRIPRSKSFRGAVICRLLKTQDCLIRSSKTFCRVNGTEGTKATGKFNKSRSMSWLHIVHDTTYFYKKTVRFGPHRLVVRPREGHDVRIEEISVEIEPAFDLEWSRDLFGNCVATAHILSPGERLRIHSEVLLHQTAPFPLRPAQRQTPTEFPVHFSEIESAVATAYLATTHPTDVAKVKEWVSTAIDPIIVYDAEEMVASIARRIRQTIKYRQREAKGVQSPSQTLSAGSGSCRDMATLMLEALRSVGCPARFPSGYLVGSAS